MVHKLLSQGSTVSFISQVTELSEADIESIKGQALVASE